MPAVPTGPLRIESVDDLDFVLRAANGLRLSFNPTRSEPIQLASDTTPPVLRLVASPSQVWPPDNRLVSIVITVTATDETDPAPTVRLRSITCDDPRTAANTQIRNRA